MKKQNGITLIALIITIIVMLILVGVTINVALNGGLIEKAKTASEQTKLEVEKEELQSLIISKMDISKETIPSDLGTITNAGITWTVTAEKQGEDIIVTITDKENENNTKTYNLKEDLKISGVSVSEHETKKAFNNYGKTYKYEHSSGNTILYAKFEKENENIALYMIELRLIDGNWIKNENAKMFVTPYDFTEIIANTPKEELPPYEMAMDGFTSSYSSASFIMFSPSYDRIYGIGELELELDNNNSINWSDYITE